MRRIERAAHRLIDVINPRISAIIAAYKDLPEALLAEDPFYLQISKLKGQVTISILPRSESEGWEYSDAVCLPPVMPALSSRFAAALAAALYAAQKMTGLTEFDLLLSSEARIGVRLFHKADDGIDDFHWRDCEQVTFGTEGRVN